MKTLRDVKVGDTVKVVKLHGEGAVKRRIMDMGINACSRGLLRSSSGRSDAYSRAA